MTSTDNKKNYLLPIIMMFALFAMISFVTGLTNPIGVIVKNQFSVPNWMSQLGNAANFIAYFFMGWPAGILLQKKGYKFTALIAVAIGFAGVGIQYLSSSFGDSTFTVYLIGCFISGFSMCLLNSVVNPMLNTLAGGGKRGNQLIQFGGSLNSLSATIVPVFVGYLIGSNVKEAKISQAAPALWIAMAIFAAAFLVLWLMAIPEPFLDANKTKEKDTHSPLSFRHFIFGIIAIFLYVGIEVGIPNFINLLLTNPVDSEGAKGLGIDAATAGSIVGTYWFLMLIGRLCGGFLGSKFSAKTQLLGVSSLGIIFILIGIFAPLGATMVSMPVFQGGASIGFGMAKVPLNVMMFALCGLCTSIMWGGIFNLAVEGLGKYTSMASGIFMIMVCGGGILPLIQGAVADISADYLTSYWVIVASLAYLFWYAIAGCHNVNKDIPVE